MKILGVIPSRYASTRFPGKPLARIGDKSMVHAVYSQVSKSKLIDKVYVATDHKQIEEHVRDFGGNVMMTSEKHRNGTERIYELVSRLSEEYDAVVNIQGDEPFIQAEQIDLLCEAIAQNDVDIATLAKKISIEEELFSPDVVKVVFNDKHKAHYFSRQPIPYLRSVEQNNWISEFDYFKHIGLYAYKTKVLKQLVDLPPSHLEQAESLEQLRWLEAGYHIYIRETEFETFGIDRPEDIDKALKML
ncbi:MAG: 3-deoxy-manno-octulosonate cytidylyltransferase [Bacteroidetes bacterium]|nr:MAG: 3-deoxy-manno-octulosonate cytidylyltransferase [Bacteroidota bacterium]